jgi:hypothetical protein
MSTSSPLAMRDSNCSAKTQAALNLRINCKRLSEHLVAPPWSTMIWPMMSLKPGHRAAAIEIGQQIPAVRQPRTLLAWPPFDHTTIVGGIECHFGHARSYINILRHARQIDYLLITWDDRIGLAR